MNFENLYKDIIQEKKSNPKTLSGYDYYKSVRKGTPKPGAAFKDKSKYNRKEKHKKGLYESKDNKNYYRQISDILSSHGIKAHEQQPLIDIIQKAIKLAFNEGYKAAESNPFKK
jgi:hypothetical protein